MNYLVVVPPSGGQWRIPSIGLYADLAHRQSLSNILPLSDDEKRLVLGNNHEYLRDLITNEVALSFCDLKPETPWTSSMGKILVLLLDFVSNAHIVGFILSFF